MRGGRRPVAVDVVLVDLVGDEDEPLAAAEPHEVDEVVVAEAAAHRVARVDDDQRLGRRSRAARLGEAALDGGHAQAPPGVLVHVVAHLARDPAVPRSAE